jgi:hypothetical protein
MTDSRNLFWDSCVFIRYITRKPDIDLHHLDAIIEDVRSKDELRRRKIFYSTLALTEIRPRHLKPHHGTIIEFFSSLGRNFEPVDPNPNILAAAGELRDVTPTDPSTNKESARVVGTPDAIQLMTASFIKDEMGVSELVFQTYDKGRGAAWEGKCVPLLGLERWFPEVNRAPAVKRVCDLARKWPIHPHPGLAFGGSGGEEG